jgi:hypothetical protein
MRQSIPGIGKSFPNGKLTVGIEGVRQELTQYRFDLIWTDPVPYDEIVSETSEQCRGLD